MGYLTENMLKNCRASHDEFNWTFYGVPNREYAERLSRVTLKKNLETITGKHSIDSIQKQLHQEHHT